MKKIRITILSCLVVCITYGQPTTKTMLKLPDTGQTGDYTTTFGEDADYTINAPSFTNNGNGTITDNVTGLMWQQTDGGEMTVESAATYVAALRLGGFADWRLPTAHEGFSILNHQNNNPAVNTTYFTTTAAEYWWTSDKQVGDATKIWCTNAGGGIGNHPKSETVSAGGVKKFHIRAVRNIAAATTVANPFTDNGDGTVKDNLTGLIWQKMPNPNTLTWEQALTYAEGLTLGGASDWRLPNIKELESINDERIVNPSVSTTYFSTIGIKNYWSSTSLPNQTTRAWYLSTQFGITTYDLKTSALSVITVRGSSTTTSIGLITDHKNVFFLKATVANNVLNVVVDDVKPTALRIFNVVGQEVMRAKVQGAQQLDIQSLPNGLYIIETERGEVARFIKQ